jgi:hypothetical protein
MEIMVCRAPEGELPAHCAFTTTPNQVSVSQCRGIENNAGGPLKNLPTWESFQGAEKNLYKSQGSLIIPIT